MKKLKITICSVLLLLNRFIFLQFCYECDPSRPDKRHPPEYAVDGMETWWQSPPLSRGMKYNEVNLTIDLGQVRFHTLSRQIMLYEIKVHLCTCDQRKVADLQI